MSVLARDPETLRPERYLLNRALDRWELTPLRITVIYLVLGTIALYFSDVFLVNRFTDPLLSQLQAIKGAVEVLLTGGLIFGLTRTHAAQTHRQAEVINRKQEELLVLHRVLRHNLRNSLNVIMGLADVFSESEYDTTVKQRGRVIRRTANNILHITEQASRIRRVTARNGHRVEMDLSSRIPHLLEEHPLNDDSVVVRTEWPESAQVEVNHMFLEAVEELLRNAIEHNNTATPQIDIAVDPNAGPLHLTELRISDNGPGISDQVVSILREAESDQMTHLEGMGLWFVYWVISESDGHMVFDEPDDGGALVRLRVPTAMFGGTHDLGLALPPKQFLS